MDKHTRNSAQRKMQVSTAGRRRAPGQPVPYLTGTGKVGGSLAIGLRVETLSCDAEPVLKKVLKNSPRGTNLILPGVADAIGRPIHSDRKQVG